MRKGKNESASQRVKTDNKGKSNIIQPLLLLRTLPERHLSVNNGQKTKMGKSGHPKNRTAKARRKWLED